MAKKKNTTKETVDDMIESAVSEHDDKLTIKQENFVRYYLELGNASEAYRRAYDAENMLPETIHVRACELLKHSKVAARVTAYKERSIQQVALTTQIILDELAQARLLALQLEQPAAMIQASMGRAKVGGLIVDKKEVGAPGEFDGKTADELREFIASESAALNISPRSSRSNGTKH